MKIVAMSDQHGELPAIPPCDLLIVAGDQIPDYPKRAEHRVGSGPQVEQQELWFRDVWLPWRQQQPAKMCILTWGNHDYYGERLHRTDGDRVSFGDAETVAIVDGLFHFGGLRIWLTPWSSQFRDWAFMKEEADLATVYAPIPAGIDILVSHQPPRGFCDVVPGTHDDDCPLRWHPSSGANSCTCGCEAHLGSAAFLEAVLRVAPRVVVCGHIHNGYGRDSIEVMDEGRKNGTVDIYNVAVVDEGYRMVHAPTEFELAARP